MVGSVCRNTQPKLMLGDLGQLAGLQVGAIGFDQRLVAAFRSQIDDAIFSIALSQVHAIFCKEIFESGLRKAALHGNQHRLIIFVAVLIDHHQNLIELGKYIKGQPTDQMRILQSDVRRKQRHRHTAAKCH